MAQAPKGKTATVLFSPHIHVPFDTPKIMWAVNIALLPAAIASVYFFGFAALHIMLLSVGTAVASEALMNLFMKQKLSITDGSAVITGLLFAFNLPPAAPWYVVVVGAAFSIVIVKMLFGGLGYNIMNPALGGRVFVLAAWSTAMINNWSPTIRSLVKGGMKMSEASTKIVDSVSSASALNNLKAYAEQVKKLSDSTATVTNGGTNVVDAMTHSTASGPQLYSYADLFWGNVPGCIGETSAFAIILGGLMLMLIRVIRWHIPVIYIATVALLTWILGGLPLGYGWFHGDPLYHILSGGLMLGAFFMATDYVTSPMSVNGTIVYAVLLGLLTTVIRLWGGYPEGVSYSIVIMNFFVPIIDKYIKPRIYGRGKAVKA